MAKLIGDLGESAYTPIFDLSPSSAIKTMGNTHKAVITDSGQVLVALAAIATQGLLAFPEGAEPLLEAVKDKRVAVRRKAAQMLGRLHV